jgi:hypothetical protein
VKADLELMRKIERAMARNLQDYVTAYHSIAPWVGTECVDVAGGVAAFTGIDSPLTTVKGMPAELSTRDLDAIESFFQGRGATAVTIEMAPWPSRSSQQLFSERGYGVVGHEDVVATTSVGSRLRRARRAEAVPVEAWSELTQRSYELPDDSPASPLVEAAAHLPNARYYGICEDGEWIACAQSVTYDDVVIFGNDGTRPEARRRGAQTALIEERLAAVPAGTIVTAEVAPGSVSERNYLRCGFRIAYTRAHYVRRLD